MKYLILLLLAIPSIAFAERLGNAKQIDHINNSDYLKNEVGDTVVHGDKHDALGLGFSYGLGDVDINDCVISTQKGNIIFGSQGYDWNLWCMGEVYDAKGLYRMGALMRCDIDSIRVHFSDDDSCIAANEIKIPTTPVGTEVRESFEEHEEAEAQHDDRLDALEQRLNREAAARRAAAQKREKLAMEFLEQLKEVKK